MLARHFQMMRKRHTGRHGGTVLQKNQSACFLLLVEDWPVSRCFLDEWTAMLNAEVVTESEYWQALSEIQCLVALEPDRGTPIGDRLDALTSLAESFEAERLVLDLADIDAR